MASVNDFPARGKVREVRGDTVVFLPSGTNYEWHLKTAGGTYAGPVGVPVAGLVRLSGRKVYAVPSGGNFVAPIFGPPKTVQGRVRFIDETSIVIRAGVDVVVTVPTGPAAVELKNGTIAVNTLVNAVCLPGGTFELLPEAAAVG